MALKSDYNHQNWYESVKLKAGLHCAMSDKFKLKAYLVKSYLTNSEPKIFFAESKNAPLISLYCKPKSGKANHVFSATITAHFNQTGLGRPDIAVPVHWV